jgi:hypothetical protein
VRRGVGLALIVAAVALAAAVVGAARAARPFETAVVGADPQDFGTVHALGATMVRITIGWSSVAPAAPVPAGFQPSNPRDPHYDWSPVDVQVEQAVKHGLQPILDIVGAPSWAQAEAPAGYPSNSGFPELRALAQFARAAALRYGGHVGRLPRVRYWAVWNEPNLSTYLSPQMVRGDPVAPRFYGEMVDAMGAAVKAVHANNLVVAGELAPFRDITPETHAQNKDWGPLSFMRSLLCVSPQLHPTCNRKVRVDIWSTHPYTSGGPTHNAELPNDVSLGNLGEMRAILDAAVASHHVLSRGTLRFWVTEFSWDSDPPDPGGVPTKLLERWVPQALYEMWRSGVSLVTWFSLRDEPMTTSPFQAGFYYVNGRPKPYLEGFRFPLVAFPRGSGVYVWGRTPWGKSGRVVVEQRMGGGAWKRLGIVSTGSNGVFEQTFHVPRSGRVRGCWLGSAEQTLPFSLKAVPDRFFNPFGSQESNQAAGRGG